MSASLEQRLRALEDADAIRALKARYLEACDRKDLKAFRASFADGKVDIDYGAIGRFDSADALAAVYQKMACHPHMVEMHHGMNPQIEVLDETRARGKWSLHYFLINTETRGLTQLAGYYEDEYEKRAGAWKIVRTKFVPTSTLALDIGAGNVKALFAGSAPPAA
ncbi:MAG TPA: nuclear transport factor 2 family protein [Candidatus Binatia bacterium]|nr:nuclear transport factor 2 family protein [Candidatus Binatia bacterium]